MKNYKAHLQLSEIQEEDSKEFSNIQQSATGDSFLEYSFDINSSLNNQNSSLNINNPFKPFLEKI